MESHEKGYDGWYKKRSEAADDADRDTAWQILKKIESLLGQLLTGILRTELKNRNIDLILLICNG